jgi:hypothetical protein
LLSGLQNGLLWGVLAVARIMIRKWKTGQPMILRKRSEWEFQGLEIRYEKVPMVGRICSNVWNCNEKMKECDGFLFNI